MKSAPVKLLIMMLILSLSLTIIGGCSEKKEVLPDTKAQTSASSGGGQSTFDPYKFNIKKISFFAPFVLLSETGTTNNNSEVFKELEKRTGVTVEWIHPPENQAKEKLTLLFASQNYPDLIMTDWKKIEGGAAKYAKDGIIIKLNDLIDKAAPDIKELLGNNPNYIKGIRDDEGSIYYIPEFRDPETGIYEGPVIRGDWLEKLGLKVPQTIDELYACLKAFKTRDPNGNNEPDEIPFSGATFQGKDTDTTPFDVGRLLWAWGTHYDFYQKDGKVKYGALEPEFLEGMKTIVQWFKEGLIDPEYPILVRQTLDAKVMNNKVGASFHMQPTKFMTTMKDKQPDFKIIGMPWLKGLNGQQGCFDKNYGAVLSYGTSTAITTAAKDPVEAIKWINYAFSKEGSLLFNFGVEGKSYNMVNGEPIYSELITKNKSPNTELRKWSLALSSWTINEDVRYYRQMVVNDYSRDAIKTWGQIGDITKQRLPLLTFTADENSKIAEKMSEINVYSDEMMDKFVMGKESLDKYEGYVAQLKKLGIEEVIQEYQKALDRYNK